MSGILESTKRKQEEISNNLKKYQGDSTKMVNELMFLSEVLKGFKSYYDRPYHFLEDMEGVGALTRDELDILSEIEEYVDANNNKFTQNNTEFIEFKKQLKIMYDMILEKTKRNSSIGEEGSLNHQVDQCKDIDHP